MTESNRLQDFVGVAQFERGAAYRVDRFPRGRRRAAVIAAVGRPPVSPGSGAAGGRPFRATMTLLVLLLAPFLAQADATIANVATPAIRSDLGASASSAELVIGGYLIAYAVLLITGARLGHLYGYGRLYVIGLVAFGIASAAAGLAPDVGTLVATRFVQGAAAALMYPQTLTGIQALFTGAARTRAISSFAIALAGGAVSGQILGGVLVSADILGSGWRPIFLINVPLVVLGLVGIARYMPRHVPSAGRADAAADRPGLDLVGVGLLSLASLLLIVPLIVGAGLGWPAWSIVMLALAVPAWCTFVANQRRRAKSGRPVLVNIAVVARRPVLGGLAAIMAATATYYALLFVLAQYIQQTLGRSALVSGLVLVPWVAAFGIAGQVARLLPARWHVGLPVAGYTVLAVAYGALALDQQHAAGIDAVLLTLLAVGGFGLGLGFASLINHLTNSVEARYAADVSGASTTTLQIGGAIGIAGFGAVYLASSGSGSGAFAITGLCLAGVSVLAAAFAFVATRRTAPREGEQ